MIDPFETLSVRCDRWNALLTPDRAVVRRALRFPWCVPETLPPGLTPPPASPPGWVLLVSVDGRNGSSATLLAFGPEFFPQVPFESSVELGRQARRTEERAARVAVRGLPILPVDTLHRLSRRNNVYEVYVEGPGKALHDGTSFGLAMGISRISLLLDMPVSSDLCALATLEEDMGLEPVGMLDRKMRMLSTSACAVRRIIVAADQKDEADIINRDLPRPLTVIGARRLSEVLEMVFPDLENHCMSRLEQGRICELSDRVFRTALQPTPDILGWKGLARCVEATLERFSDMDPASRWKIEFVRDVARRHTGDESPLPWPDADVLKGFLRPVRLHVLSHVVQSIADSECEPDRAHDIANRAMSHLLAPADRGPDDFRLLGAVGRLLSAIGAMEEAADMLRQAVEGWFGLFDDRQASFALSELLRVVGVQGNGMGFDTCRTDFVNRFCAAVADERSSLGFVFLSLGRASLQLDRPTDAVQFLDDGIVQWDATQEHLRASRLRWMARAQARLGNAAEAVRLRDQIRRVATENPDGDFALFAHLIRLDAAIEANADPLAIIELLRQQTRLGHEFRRLDNPALPPEQRARRIADHFRY